ncbi:MAG: hypothetical protein OFPI_40950 [Osedax symbiont Rs2]|nr:MAG: hypothetical protein OFPI_40950 [Osedax symbiont Rs2]
MHIPSAKRYHFNSTAVKPLLTGADRQLDRLVGWVKFRSGILKSFSAKAEIVGSIIDKYSNLSDLLLESKMERSRGQFQRKSQIQQPQLHTAIALIAIASRRVLGLQPYPVQIMAVIALYQGYLIEMETGEGKTLVSGLSAILYAWHKHPSHVLTVNDYLAERDMQFIKPLHNYCKVDVAAVSATMSPDERQLHYRADIVYTTSQELLADYLRDRIKLEAIGSLEMQTLNSAQQKQPSAALVTRGIHSVIIDEADSILIDQAISPLLISAPVENELLTEAVLVSLSNSRSLQVDRDYTVNREYRSISLQPSAKEKIAQLASILPRKWQGESRREELLIQALTAREFFLLDKHYVIKEDKIVIVDEFTGRLMPNRNWGLGLHQAIEAKEGVTITPPNETVDRMSFQNFFRLFNKKCGMTGTASEASKELWDIYQFPVMAIPRNLPCRRQLLDKVIFKTKQEKWQQLILFVKQLQDSGQAVLIGTRTVQDSETLAQLCTAQGLQYQLLNANYSDFEAQIISQAGQSACITIATNMAGRGTDIILDQAVKEAGGVCVLMSELHNSKRIDRQLIGRCARQGDPGSSKTFLSLEDDLIQENIPKSMHFLLSIKGLTQILFSLAQAKAELKAYTQRQVVLKSDVSLKESLSFVK